MCSLHDLVLVRPVVEMVSVFIFGASLACSSAMHAIRLMADICGLTSSDGTFN